MESSSKANFNGCFIAIGIFALLAILGVIGVFSFYRSVAREHEQERSERVRQEARERVTLQVSELSTYSATDFGETLTKENFIAIVCDDNATSLSKGAFARAANGLRVTWELKVENLSDGENGNIRGDFSIPYEFRERNRSRGSEVRIRAEFPAGDSARLANLRKEQWVVVTGDLQFEEANPRELTMLNAGLAEERTETGEEDSGAVE